MVDRRLDDGVELCLGQVVLGAVVSCPVEAASMPPAWTQAAESPEASVVPLAEEHVGVRHAHDIAGPSSGRPLIRGQGGTAGVRDIDVSGAARGAAGVAVVVVPPRLALVNVLPHIEGSCT